MEERGEFPTRFIIARRSRPTTTRTIGPPSSHWAPCEASVAQAAKSEGKGVYSFTCTFIFHGERKHEKKGSEKRLLILYSLLVVLKYTINLSAYAVFKAEARRALYLSC